MAGQLALPVGYELREVEGPLAHGFRPESGFNSVHAAEPLKAGQVITRFGARATHAKPNMYTLQVSEHEHVDLDPAILQFTNHSCDPSAFFNTADRVLEALRDLQPGDEITFFYPSTELQMDVPFTCCCGSAKCLGSIRGALHMPAEVLAHHRINAHVKQLLARGQQQQPAVA